VLAIDMLLTGGKTTPLTRFTELQAFKIFMMSAEPEFQAPPVPVRQPPTSRGRYRISCRPCPMTWTR
jgi:hypothetical protein